MKSALDERLIRASADERVQLVYEPRDRNFAIRCLRPREVPGLMNGLQRPPDRFVMIQGIEFCPWSGAPLPGELVKELVRTVQSELGLADFGLIEDGHKLPDEFRTDQWWKKRGHDGHSTNEVLRAGWKRPKPVRGRVVVTTLDLPPERWPASFIGQPRFLPPGFHRPEGHPPHLCRRMFDQLDDYRVMIAYLPWTREYGIRVLDPFVPADYQHLRIQPILYCPWCGEKLPASLREEWRNQFSPDDFTIPDPEIDASPPPYASHWLSSELWWRKSRRAPTSHARARRVRSR